MRDRRPDDRSEGDAFDGAADAPLDEEIRGYYRSIRATRAGPPLAFLGIIEIEAAAEACRSRIRWRRSLVAVATAVLLVAGTGWIVGPPAERPQAGAATGGDAAPQIPPPAGAGAVAVVESPAGAGAPPSARELAPARAPASAPTTGVGGASADGPVGGRIGGAAGVGE